MLNLYIYIVRPTVGLHVLGLYGVNELRLLLRTVVAPALATAAENN